MSVDLQLDSLLSALRTAGLRIGVSEVLRLQQVFASQPILAGGHLSRERLKSLVRAVLVKSVEDRATFDRICDAWMHRAEEDLEMRRVRPRRVSAPLPVRRGSRWRSVLQQAAQSVLLTGLLLTVGRDMRVFPLPASPPDPFSHPHSQLPGEGELPPAVTPDDVRKRTFRTSVATLEVTPRYQLVLFRPETGVAALAWLGAGGLWLALRRRRLLPKPEPAAPAEGPPRAFPVAVPPAGAVLLAPRAEEGLAWGIGRFVSEEPTRRLDLAATVQATALAGGLPAMHFHRARFYREVWLWLDEDTDDPALPRLADEIETVLAAHGLPVERAAFRGIPNRLVRKTGQVFAPTEVDERRDVALVAILTDGRRLVRRWAADDQRVRIDTLLRSLSHWPHLAFVDASQEGTGLAAILDRHGIATVAPECTAAFLAGAPPPREAPRPVGRAVRGEAAWAAACALCPASVDEFTALELRRRLGLAASPFGLQGLRAEAPGPPGRLAWRATDRVRRVSWLREAEAHPASGVAPESFLDQALGFWERVYDRSLGKLLESTGEGDYPETAAERFLRMERALLGLWRKPGEYIAELYRLYQGPLQEVIRQHCEILAPADWGGNDVIHLPWSRSERTPVERAMLLEMRFSMPSVGLRRPGRAWLGIGLLVGLGCAAAGMAALHGRAGKQPEILHAGERPADAVTDIAPARNGWLVTVATPQWNVAEEVENGSRVLVRWQSRQLPCVEEDQGGHELWHCGRSTVPSLLPGVSRSVVILDRELGKASVERLALNLLDSGSADVVRIDESSRQLSITYSSGEQVLALTRNPGPLVLMGPLGKTQEMLERVNRARKRMGLPVLREPTLRYAIVSGERLDRVEDLLRFDGLRSVSAVLPEFYKMLGNPSKVLLRGLGAGCRNTQIEENGFTFVRICPGTFMMGSRTDDPQSFDDETPAHQVTLAEFWLSKFETTNEQYRKLHSGYTGEPDLPVTSVTWTEAHDFCEKLGYRLPTEAEWEYAARAGTRTPWSSGSDEKDLERFAWFDKNSGGELHPVGQKEPNPWGLHDMHGNVWEWVEDWYGPYSPEAQVNPTGPSDGTRRVLRGGSADWARDLRAANRYNFRPEDRFGNVGFRCVRGPHRQP